MIIALAVFSAGMVRTQVRGQTSGSRSRSIEQIVAPTGQHRICQEISLCVP